MFLKKKLIICLCIVSILCVFSLYYNSIAEKFIQNNEITNANTEYLSEMWEDTCLKYGELDTIEGIDDAVITVNGHPITRRDIEIQKIINEEFGEKISLKDYIVSQIGKKAMMAEAERLNITPSQEKIDAHIEQVMDILENRYEGSEPVLDYINVMGMTNEEYIEFEKKTVYDMFLREALWLSVEPTGKYKGYDEYVDELVNNADIEYYN